MSRLRAIEIRDFRGVHGCLRVNLHGQSLAIYGENAIGKSSISDALEWFYTDRVGHLWKENCKQEALRNVLASETTTSSVALFFSDNRLNCTKSLSASLESEYSNASNEFKDHLHKIRDGQERIVLRNVDLWDFVLSTKTEKRERLAELIGYESLDSFREVISRTQTRLEATPDFVAAKRNISEYQREIFRIAGTQLANSRELYQRVGKMVEGLGTSVAISDDESYRKAIDELQKRIEAKEKTALKVALSQCREACDQVKSKAGDAVSAYRRFKEIYQDLISSEEGIRQVRLESFLTLGERAVNERLTPTDTCPLCLQPKRWTVLRRELSERIAKLRGSKKKVDAAEAEKALCLSSLSEATSTARDLYRSANKAHCEQAFLDVIKRYGRTLVDLDSKIKSDFDKFRPISSEIEGDTALITEAIDRQAANLKNQIDALELSKEEQELFETIRKLENLKLSYERYRGAIDTIDKFTRQIRTVAAIGTAFAKVHGGALQNVLDVLSHDISRYYLTMHPGEQIDDIKLRVLEEGIEFEYGFHGKRAYPPLKYLSESHLNSLGIAAFLASAKLFNRTVNFLILDDVVTSFDSNHRLRLVRLLHDEFADRQLLILTHEPFWFRIIKKQLGPQGWLFTDLEEGPESTVQVKSSAKTLVEDIMRRKSEGSLTANDLRTSLERILKDVAVALEVRVAFRYNDTNEQRMAGELISELRATLKKKSTATVGEGTFARLAVCALVATAGSHDSGPVLSSGDITSTYEDVVNLNQLFFCAECNEYVSVERFVNHEGKAFCKCGKKSIQWKE